MRCLFGVLMIPVLPLYIFIRLILFAFKVNIIFGFAVILVPTTFGMVMEVLLRTT